jgi:hypothetical protein
MYVLRRHVTETAGVICMAYGTQRLMASSLGEVLHCYSPVALSIGLFVPWPSWGMPPLACFWSWAVSSHHYRHLLWGLGWHSCLTYFSSMGSPGTHPSKAIHHIQGSFQPHHQDSTTLSCYHLAASIHIGGWLWSYPYEPQWHFFIGQS